MPTVTVYTDERAAKEHLKPILSSLRKFTAQILSCGDRALEPEEISIRVVSTSISEMIAPIEIEIIAHHYPERIEAADKICLSIRAFVKEQLSSATDVRVWLLLTELGHSWNE